MGDSIIVGLSGRCQSGKTTAAEFIARELPSEKHRVHFLNFADSLKQICIDLFGFTREQLYDDKLKNVPVDHIRWENMPGIITDKWHYDFLFGYKNLKDFVVYHEPGPMTPREFMEFFGTEICRKIFEPCWINATMADIRKFNEAHDSSKTNIHVIGDVRAPNEIKRIKNEGGAVFRLTRNPENRQTGLEKLLDQDGYDWNNFNAVIDNSKMSLDLKNEVVMLNLKRIIV